MTRYRVMRIDPRSVTPDAVTFAAEVLTINPPQRVYRSGVPYFVRLVDEIPETTTVGAAVEITIGAGTVTYPLVDCRGAPVTAEQLRSGYSYPVELAGGGTAGAFALLAPLKYCTCVGPLTADGTEGGGNG